MNPYNKLRLQEDSWHGNRILSVLVLFVRFLLINQSLFVDANNINAALCSLDVLLSRTYVKKPSRWRISTSCQRRRANLPELWTVDDRWKNYPNYVQDNRIRPERLTSTEINNQGIAENGWIQYPIRMPCMHAAMNWAENNLCTVSETRVAADQLAAAHPSAAASGRRSRREWRNLPK